MDELTDPETLREREDVEFIDAPPEEHQSHFEMYEPIMGMAITGVTDANGQLLLLQREDAPISTMPYGWAETGDDWVAAVREAVADSTGVAITVNDVLRVRCCTYCSEAGEETTGYDVVFTATPESGQDISEATGLSCRDEWTAAWRDTARVDLPDDETNDVVSDIRLFVE